MTEPRPAPQRELAWLDQGTALFLDRLAAIADTGLGAPTPLPGWTRRHVAAHVGYNARALLRLTHWARTGEATPMYESSAARSAEIEQGAGLGALELRGLVRTSAAELQTALDGLPGGRWASEVVTAQGRTVPAAEIPWMRCREVWVHAVDLGNGAAFGDFPAGLIDALITDVTAMWRRRGQGPALRLAPTDRDRTWEPAAGIGPPVVIDGPAAGIAAWLTGRGGTPMPGTADGRPLPALGRWL